MKAEKIKADNDFHCGECPKPFILQRLKVTSKGEHTRLKKVG